MVSHEPRHGVRRPVAVVATLLVALVLGDAGLTPPCVRAQNKGGEHHTKVLVQDLAQLKELFKNKLVIVEVSAGSMKNYQGTLAGVRQILGERFLELRRPEEGGFAGDSIDLINIKSIVAIRQQ